MTQQFMFTTPFEVEEKAGDVHLDGFISTTDKDLVNDIVTENCLKSMLSQIRERNIKLDLEHESFKGDTNEEKEIAKTIVPIGRIVDGTIQSSGLRVKGVLNKFHRRFNETKGSVQDKFLDAFSIAFIPTKVHFEEKAGENIRMLDDLKLLNVALTGNPVNTSAQIADVFVKSMDFLDEKGLDNPRSYVAGKPLPPRSSRGLPGSTEADKIGQESDDEKPKKKKKATSPQSRRTQARNEAIRESEETKPHKKKKTKKTEDDSIGSGAVADRVKRDIKDLIEDYKNDPTMKDSLEVKDNNYFSFTGNLSDIQIKAFEAITDLSFSLNSELHNHKEVKNMTEEETENQEASTEEATEEPKEEAEATEEAKADEEGEEEAPSEEAAKESESLEEVKSKLADLNKKFDILLEQKNKAKTKARVHKAEFEDKSREIEPLDLLN